MKQNNMFITKKQYVKLCERIAKCEKNIRKLKAENMRMVKRILREPDKLSEELKAQEDIETYIERVISC